jgi:anti-sigma factor RsiW
MRVDSRCKKIFAALSDYLDAELKSKDRRELEEHLRGCPPCVRYLRTLKLTTEACRQYGRLSTPSLSPEAQSALLARLVKGLEERTRAKRSSPRALTQSRTTRKYS